MRLNLRMVADDLLAPDRISQDHPSALVVGRLGSDRLVSHDRSGWPSARMQSGASTSEPRERRAATQFGRAYRPQAAAAPAAPATSDRSRRPKRRAQDWRRGRRRFGEMAACHYRPNSPANRRHQSRGVPAYPVPQSRIPMRFSRTSRRHSRRLRSERSRVRILPGTLEISETRKDCKRARRVKSVVLGRRRLVTLSSLTL